MSRYLMLNKLLGLDRNDLIRRPIKDLRRELKANCYFYGIHNVKELSLLLSKERRREKKVIYSYQERQRIENKSKNNEGEIETLEELKLTLINEKIRLQEEISFYQNEINQITSESQLIIEGLELLLPHDILEILDN
ncbi:hypothetical protein LOD99_11194 [Oopsacas minuta]|uniref:Uncharacterized protein n=1 Tax=Oopsacas minuta TaxID=111878 RepID=A0AAV7K956_9METZ|nr:hypothetical protein LOD99_11194 [Oopsacas minuta]